MVETEPQQQQQPLLQLLLLLLRWNREFRIDRARAEPRQQRAAERGISWGRGEDERARGRTPREKYKWEGVVKEKERKKWKTVW